MGKVTRKGTNQSVVTWYRDLSRHGGRKLVVPTAKTSMAVESQGSAEQPTDRIAQRRSFRLAPRDSEPGVLPAVQIANLQALATPMFHSESHP